MLTKYIAAGNEINLALVAMDAKDFTTDAARDLVRRTIFEDAERKYELRSLREAVLCHQVSALVANRPMMISLFDDQELKAMCRLRVSPALADQFTAAKRRHPSFGLVEIMALGVRGHERHVWGFNWE